jgi:hypothetical protein
VTLVWWTCPFCAWRTADQHAQIGGDTPEDAAGKVAVERDRHKAAAHPAVVHWGSALSEIHRYPFKEVHR